MSFRKLEDSRRVLAALALGLVGVNVVLGAALATVSFRPHPLVVTPLVKDAQFATPGDVPPDAVRRFILHYLSYFDDYTAHTLKDRSNYILRYISPAYAETAARALTERFRYVERAREASQLQVPTPDKVEVTRTGENQYRAVVVASKRIYLADRLTEETEVRYTVDVRPALPTPADPFGFVVTGQRVEALPREKPAETLTEKGRKTP